MKIPEPEPGLIIHYAYLWRREHDSGRDEGQKDRPCAIIAGITKSVEVRKIVRVAPITHQEPLDKSTAIEMPQAVKLRLGLDHARSWIICNEINRFEWPGTDLRPLAGSHAGDAAYGFLPPRLLARVTEKILQFTHVQKLSVIKRSG